jgi:hypothetical protein
MNYLGLCLLALLSLNTMESVSYQKKSLKAMLDERKDHRRVVLLYGRFINQGRLIEQQQLFNAEKDGLAERDIDIVVVIDTELQEPDRWYLMHNNFEFVPSDDFAGYLIGKDGTLKKKFRQVMPAEELFGLVDAMPMRRQEMKHD